jgi:hypothetical protein
MEERKRIQIGNTKIELAFSGKEQVWETYEEQNREMTDDEWEEVLKKSKEINEVAEFLLNDPNVFEGNNEVIDDESNIMRALGNGDGDRFGFD